MGFSRLLIVLLRVIYIEWGGFKTDSSEERRLWDYYLKNRYILKSILELEK